MHFSTLVLSMDIGFPRKSEAAWSWSSREQSGVVLIVSKCLKLMSNQFVMGLLPPPSPCSVCLCIFGTLTVVIMEALVMLLGTNNKTSSRDRQNWELLRWQVCKISLPCGVLVKSEKKSFLFWQLMECVSLCVLTKDDWQYLMLGDYLVIVYRCC